MCGAKRHVRFTPRADMCGAVADVRSNSGHGAQSYLFRNTTVLAHGPT